MVKVMNKYHPLLVAFHWILVPMLMLALIMGGAILDHIPNDSPDKIEALQMHMIVGLSIFGLMILRLVTRLFTKKPPHADSGNPLLNKLGVLAHYALYLLVFMMAASGIGTSLLAGLPDIIFGGSGTALPETFEQFLPRIAHGIIAKVLFVMIILHVLAALYHQFIRKDGLFGRMWFGKRNK